MSRPRSFHNAILNTPFHLGPPPTFITPQTGTQWLLWRYFQASALVASARNKTRKQAPLGSGETLPVKDLRAVARLSPQLGIFYCLARRSSIPESIIPYGRCERYCIHSCVTCKLRVLFAAAMLGLPQARKISLVCSQLRSLSSANCRAHRMVIGAAYVSRPGYIA